MKKRWLAMLVCCLLLGACAFAQEAEMAPGGKDRINALNIDPGFWGRTQISPGEPASQEQWYRIWSQDGGRYNLKVGCAAADGMITVSLHNRNQQMTLSQTIGAGEEYILPITLPNREFIIIKVAASCEADIVLALCDGVQHGPGVRGDVVKAATCFAEGEETYVCAACDQELGVRSIPATEHIPGSWVEVKPVTCTAEGIREQRCAMCGVEISSVKTAAYGHSPGEWRTVREAACEQTGLRELACTLCGAVIESETLDALGHRYTEWEILTEPTKKQEGERRRHCIGCGDTQLEKLEKLPKFLGIF